MVGHLGHPRHSHFSRRYHNYGNHHHHHHHANHPGGSIQFHNPSAAATAAATAAAATTAAATTAASSQNPARGHYCDDVCTRAAWGVLATLGGLFLIFWVVTAVNNACDKRAKLAESARQEDLLYALPSYGLSVQPPPYPPPAYPEPAYPEPAHPQPADQPVDQPGFQTAVHPGNQPAVQPAVQQRRPSPPAYALSEASQWTSFAAE